MIILLSPAKRIDFKSQNLTEEYHQPYFTEEAKCLNEILKKFSQKELMDIMKINLKIAEENFQRFLSWHLPFTPENAKQAILAFNGDVFNGLQAKTLSKDELNFAHEHILILSGFYGVLKALDLIQPYRLEMGTHLKANKNSNLYEFWGNKINNYVNTELNNSKPLINLASNEYFKAILPKKINSRIVTPVFKQLKDDTIKMVPILAKRARGLMTRFIIKNKLENVEDLKHFDYENYFFDDKLSTENEWIFVR